MRPSEDCDRVGLLPPGIGYKPAEPELPSVTVESVLADIARLAIEDRMSIRLKLNIAAYGVAAQAEVRQQFRDNAALQSRGKTASEIIDAHNAALSSAWAGFGKPMTGYIQPRVNMAEGAQLNAPPAGWAMLDNGQIVPFGSDLAEAPGS